MSINQILFEFNHDVPISRLENTLEVGNHTETGDIGIEKIYVRFNNHYQIEVKHNKSREVIFVLTSGGISKEIDMQTFQQLIVMNY